MDTEPQDMIGSRKVSHSKARPPDSVLKTAIPKIIDKLGPTQERRLEIEDMLMAKRVEKALKNLEKLNATNRLIDKLTKELF